MAARMEELNVTKEELERFKTAFQDARFRELFAQYAEEISDPENRQRYEQEISEMERERGMDIQFLHPKPGHVLHTSLDGQHNCFLNICSNGLVRRPHCVPGTDQEGRCGQHWSLPCSLSPAREELSPEGDREVIYDVLFHPDTLRLATNNDKFKAMVDLTALDTVAQNFHVVLDATNVHTLKEKYRGVPQACVIRKPRPGAKPKPRDPGDPLSFPYPYDVPGGQTKASHGHLKAQHSFPRDRKACPEPTVPRYTIRHRSYIDMQDYRDARDAAPSPVPKELVITVDLPLLRSASEVNLHIEGKALSLESQKPAYKLQLKLPYLVEEERGTAQFNKIKRQLVVTVPVVQQNVLKLMQDKLADIPEHEPKLSISPDPTTLESGDTQESGGASESPSSEEEPEKVEEPTVDEGAINSLPEVSPECPIFTCSQDATSLTLVIHVKDIDEHSITSEVGSYQCEIRFCVKHTNVPYVLVVQFLPQYNLNTNDIAVKVSEDNIVIELTKSSECFGLWKNLYFGVNSNSLQERRFINEDNVTEFLESGLRPSTIPWSTLEDQPMINVLEMNDERTHIHLNKPELEEECYLTHREQYADLSDVKKQISYQSDETGLSDTGAGNSLQDPQPDVESHGRQFQSPAEHPAGCSCPRQLEDSSAEDEGLYFKDIPASELDEDDIPDVTEQVQSPVLQNSEPNPVLKEIDAKDGSVHVISDHKTQCAFSFENALLFELD